MSNRLKNETSPYLLQHKDNPVDWYPWCNEAFERAKKEDKPVFLSIGYSACHWCHVLAHESFEDEEIADILNRYYISVKVDREERPDIDSVYMNFCQAFTGSGGWPTSIFMTADKKPFFAGTYFPKTARGGMIGMKELLLTIQEKWENDRPSLLKYSEKAVASLRNESPVFSSSDIELAHSAMENYEKSYDKTFGGFGRAPKFPAPHNLLFLLSYYERYKNPESLDMTEHTLIQMYRGGMFDHIGFGFCRYSTDKKFLVPHFEKMLYDNALLILAYCKAYEITKKSIYLEIAEKTASYILREMTSEEGGFHSSQDADSEGEEGKYYLFTTEETAEILGEDKASGFNRHYGITEKGNFEGKSIPNLLNSDIENKSFEELLPLLENYRKKRYSLHLDDKILTFWNGLMISAMAELFLVSRKECYLEAAKKADNYIKKYLYENGTLYVSFRDKKRGVKGFSDDYASYIFAQLKLYSATLHNEYLDFSKELCEKVLSNFSDSYGGFYLYGKDSEELILRPKETYDGAVPGGNSLMAYNLVRLFLITSDEKYEKEAEKQLDFLSGEARYYPHGHAMFLTALLEFFEPPMKITVTTDNNENDVKKLPFEFPTDAVIKIAPSDSREYPLKNGKTTYYICHGHSCLPPVNDLIEVKK